MHRAGPVRRLGVAPTGVLLPAPLRETAYALACEVAAADGRPADAELQMLEMLRHRLGIDRLIAAGIERGVQARHRTL